MKVSVSFIKSKYNEEQTINLIDNSSADYIHVDIMDGIFVHNKNYDFATISYYLTNIKKPLDVHLMVSDVMSYVKNYCLLKPEYITFHIETFVDPKEIIDFIHSKNIKAGLAINPDTDLSRIKPYLNDIEEVLVMGVYPGAGGQEFIRENIDKINELMELKGNYHYIVSVDGGVNDETIKDIKSDMVVSGSFICNSDNFDEQINKLK